MMLPAPDPAFHWRSEAWGHALSCGPLAAVAQHLFTSKQLALPSDTGWRAALASLDATPDRLMRVKQVHGAVVRIVKAGGVTPDAATERPDGDAIVSNVPGLALAVMVADCVPILIADQAKGAAAAVHAGWRGTCARVVQAAVDAMRVEFGSDPRSLIAAIGPSAGPNEYEVGESLVDAFREAGHSSSNIDRWFIRGSSKPHLDLWAANRDELMEVGVPADHIYICRLSTVARPDVFASHRIDGDRAGRMAGIIVVPTSAKATVGKPVTGSNSA